MTTTDVAVMCCVVERTVTVCACRLVSVRSLPRIGVAACAACGRRCLFAERAELVEESSVEVVREVCRARRDDVAAAEDGAREPSCEQLNRKTWGAILANENQTRVYACRAERASKNCDRVRDSVAVHCIGETRD